MAASLDGAGYYERSAPPKAGFAVREYETRADTFADHVEQLNLLRPDYNAGEPLQGEEVEALSRQQVGRRRARRSHGDALT